MAYCITGLTATCGKARLRYTYVRDLDVIRLSLFTLPSVLLDVTRPILYQSPSPLHGQCRSVNIACLFVLAAECC